MLLRLECNLIHPTTALLYTEIKNAPVALHLACHKHYELSRSHGFMGDQVTVLKNEADSLVYCKDECAWKHLGSMNGGQQPSHKIRQLFTQQLP
jgi:hypothetical protein